MALTDLPQLVPILDPSDARIAAFRDIRERDLVGRDGRFIAEGRVVLNVLITKAPHTIEAILVLENRLAGIEDLLAALPHGVPVFVASAQVIDQIAGFHLHRGILALARRPAVPDIFEFILQLPENALLVILSGISNHDNMGAIFRNAAAFEADGIVLDGLCCDPMYRKSIRVSVGAVLQVPIVQAGNLVDICDQLSRAGFRLAALSPRGSKSIEALPKSAQRALILGTEGAGLPDDILSKVGTFRIAMSADFDSLNVGTAAGIALYHSSRFSNS